MLKMDIEQDLTTEQWDDVLEEKVPGRKSLLMSVFCMLFFLAVSIAFIAYRETDQKNQLIQISIILLMEGALTYTVHRILPTCPMKMPMFYVSQFFSIAGGFSFLGFLLK